MKINATLVRRLLASQFPQWQDLPINPIKPGGWDHKSFRLGEHMIVRLPSAAAYVRQVEKEQRWLPKLAPLLPLPIPKPLALGKPGAGYPWYWSIYRWLEGDTAATASIANLSEFATSLAQFILALQHIGPTDGPQPGADNFYRGGDLRIYDAETRQAIKALKDKIDVNLAIEVWEAALATSWQGKPVWVHGDISPSNLLVQAEKLSAVIDFGLLAVGDPACDLAIAWILFKGESRAAFRTKLNLDPGTWARGRAWTLWKALIVAAGFTETNTFEATQSWHIINEVFVDKKKIA